MNTLKAYIIPIVIVLVASSLVSLGLWGFYTVTQDTSDDTVVIIPDEETSTSILTSIVLFIPSLLKVLAFMGIPGLITYQVLKRLNRDESSKKLVIT